MAGTVRGSIWALGLGGVAVSMASLMTEQPAGNTPPQMPLVAAPATATPVSLENETTLPAISREVAVNASRVAVPETEIIAPAADTEPAAPPQTLQLETAQDSPARIDESTAVATLEEPALETVAAAQPQIPVEDDEAVIATQPAPPRAEVTETDAPTVVGIAEDALVVNVPDVVSEPAAPVVPQTETQPITIPEVEEAPAAPAPQIAKISEPDPLPTPEIIVPETPQEEPVVETQTPEPVIVSDAPEVPTGLVDAPEEATKAAPVENRVLRLGVSAGNDALFVDADTPDAAIAIDAPQTALHRYGAMFENPNDAPMLSVLLIDDGSNGDMATKIAELGLPVTVVLHAFDPDARDRMGAYRSAGIEVAIQVALPAGAMPTDIEVAFESIFGLLPEVSILFADGTGVLRNNRAATAQVMQILAADGRGLVTAQRGLNAAQQAAVDAGVPAVTIINDLESAGDSEDAIKRGLDQAALRARQTGNVVLLGRVQDTTLTALKDWAGGVNQDQLALAPVSAVLLDVSP
jgi:polysaccharide deacetylase 2 family uncharacterized protein YibQ